MIWLTLLQCVFLGVAVGVAADDPIDFEQQVRPLFQKYCYECHSGEQAKSGFRLDVKAAAFRGGELYGPSIHAGRPSDSPLWQFVADPDAELPMPPEGPRLSPEEIELLRAWILSGAVWPDGIDTARLDDPRDHWSFQPLRSPPVPTSNHPRRVNPIDDFVAAHLAKHQLEPAPPADKTTWLRRVTLDLTGLPPTPEELDQFLADDREEAFSVVVDRLLASPEYGPRWGQHWLDVVRYADTHGFEVNTERPNAWPYRDYVIEAFQQDKPYDQFIREQVLGDQLGVDPATGFLLTASVLLPGQIGQDDASKRLARQDALDEIVTNVGQTFLGLSIGCARCHDHRFDPITQRDYYSFQAFVAGVEYEERTWRQAAGPDREQQLASMELELGSLEQQLRQYEPLAAPLKDPSLAPTDAATSAIDENVVVEPLSSLTSRRPPIQAKSNVDRFAPIKTSRLRFTVLATNRLEPCLDELEVWNLSGDNVGRATSAVTSSGDNVAPGTHELRFVNDGVYGNSSSWMSNQTGAGWVQFDWHEPQVIEAVTWGRDRNSQYDDRLAIAYRLEYWEPSVDANDTSAAESGAWRLLADHSDRHPFGDNNSPKERGSTFVPSNEQMAVLQRRDQLLVQRAAVQKPPQVFAGRFRTPDKTHLLRRGNPELPLDELPPAFPVVFGQRALATSAEDVERRAALAAWLTEPNHPLVARVMVNRIWQGHFGTGIVATASDFGRNGEAPSHPELLDWLASEFIASGWSIKAMHRLIVLSATYRQTSVHQNLPATALDQEARWLWRYPARRLEAETIRDNLLFVAGRLNLTHGGPGFDLFAQRGGLSGFTPIETFTNEGLRRMIFAHKVRRERDVVFGAFDCPDAGQSTATRRISTTPIQALNLLNSPFALEQAEMLAQRIRQEVGNEPRVLITRLWLRCFSRPPSDQELAAAEDLLTRYDLTAVCRAVVNSSEFLLLP